MRSKWSGLVVSFLCVNLGSIRLLFVVQISTHILDGKGNGDGDGEGEGELFVIFTFIYIFNCKQTETLDNFYAFVAL